MSLPVTCMSEKEKSKKVLWNTQIANESHNYHESANYDFPLFFRKIKTSSNLSEHCITSNRSKTRCKGKRSSMEERAIWISDRYPAFPCQQVIWAKIFMNRNIHSMVLSQLARICVSMEYIRWLLYKHGFWKSCLLKHFHKHIWIH